MITVNNIAYKLNDSGNLLLDDISFELNEGEIMRILGANGSGKTTLLKIIAGVINNYTGEVKLTKAKFNIRMLPQNSEELLNPYQKVNTLLNSVKNKFNIESAELKSLLNRFNIENNLLEKTANKLSGGERQRVAFVRVLMSKPDIMLLDEPFSAQDSLNREIITTYLLNFVNSGKAVIYTSHEDIEEFSIREVKLTLKK